MSKLSHFAKTHPEAMSIFGALFRVIIDSVAVPAHLKTEIHNVLLEGEEIANALHTDEPAPAPVAPEPAPVPAPVLTPLKFPWQL